MFVWHQNEKPRGGIYDWLLANKQQILAGTAEYMGTTVTESTLFHISFDYPVSDGRDWVDESQGLILLIDKEFEYLLSGCRLDYCDGKFSAIIVPSIR